MDKKIRRMNVLLAMAFTSVMAFAAPKPLTVWIMPNGASPQETLENRLELFTKKTGIPTKVQVLDWNEAWNRISLALSGQQPAPDVLQLGTTWIPYFASRKEIQPLNSELGRIQPERLFRSAGTRRISMRIQPSIQYRGLLISARCLQIKGFLQKMELVQNLLRIMRAL